MSILIKGMEMPKSCGNCYMFSFLSDSCRITNYVTEEVNDKMLDRRFDDCPLVPIPPHGRLIDADAFLSTIRPICEEDANAACTFETVKRLMISHINNAPTIIEAEEGET